MDAEEYNDYYYNLADGKKQKSSGPNVIADQLNQYSGEFLDLGCGMGDMSALLSDKIRYTGVDNLDFSITRARQRYPGKNFLQAAADRLPFEDKSFDIMLSIAMLQYVDNPRTVLVEMDRVLKPGGRLILSAPNFELPWSRALGIKHYSGFKKSMMFVRRSFAVVQRVFGLEPFLTIPESYYEKTGKYVSGNDSMKYIASAYEVANFFKKRGYEVKSLINYPGGIRAILSKFPGLKYAWGGILLECHKV